MVSIAERPPEADERRVPGHWEGDLLIGKRNQTAIGTLIERASGFALLVPLPDGHVRPRRPRARAQGADAARGAAPLADLGPRPRDARLEASPRRRRYRGVLLRPARTLAARLQRVHRRPAAPVLPKGHDFSTVTEDELDAVADELNARPRKGFDFATPTEQLSELLLQ
jgi:transposase, IS30 family